LVISNRVVLDWTVEGDVEFTDVAID
jgi:hypothetical protein